MRAGLGKALIRAMLIGATLLPMAIGNGAHAASDSPLGAPLTGSGQFCSAPAGSSIVGVGASFANNAHQKVFVPSFASSCAKEPVTYTAGGSGKGIAAFINRTSYLTGSDDPLGIDQTACADLDLGYASNACGADPKTRIDAMQTIPIALGAVTASYNLSNCGITANEAVKLRSPVLAAIYSGLVKTWNDPLIVADNAHLANCAKDIKLIVRSDVSGTTFAWKDYLSKRNPQFAAYKQNAKNLDWPLLDLGLGTVTRGNGNGGVATLVKKTPGALGYVELSATKAAGNNFALIDGPHAQFVSADTGKTANCELAGQGATLPPSTLSPGWDTLSITDTPNPLAYPACTFTYILAHNNLKDAFGAAYKPASGRVFVDYLLNSLSAATQRKLADNFYAPLPENVRLEALLGVASIQDQV
ncbi:MAG: phosphate ABC transporter substrate-binding protein PstS [Actinomycetota bacterium]